MATHIIDLCEISYIFLFLCKEYMSRRLVYGTLWSHVWFVGNDFLILLVMHHIGYI